MIRAACGGMGGPPKPEALAEVAKALKGRRIVEAQITFYNITLKLDNGTTLKYWNSSSDYENWGAEIT